jgi:hypothetical protein
MDLGTWLRSLGLEQYEATFRENAIDSSVLPDLTDQDLEKLDVLLGHRRKLLRAIAELGCAKKVASQPTVAIAAGPRRQETAERRQLLKTDAAKERLALEGAIRKVEIAAARKSRTETRPEPPPVATALASAASGPLRPARPNPTPAYLPWRYWPTGIKLDFAERP